MWLAWLGEWCAARMSVGERCGEWKRMKARESGRIRRECLCGCGSREGEGGVRVNVDDLSACDLFVGDGQTVNVPVREW